MSYWKWAGIAKRRILSVLSKNIACTERQLQLKICEAGPYNQRVEALILTDILKQLVKSEIIIREPLFEGGQKLFYICDVDKKELEKRKENLISYYNVYGKYTQKNSYPYCGNVLENMISQAIGSTGKYNYIATIFKDECDGIKAVSKPNLVSLGSKFTDNPLDCIAIIKNNNIAIGIEIKNKNEWKYGSDKEIWKFIKKCCDLEVMPLFISRKIPAITKFFFHKAGILGMETQFQYLHPCCKEELQDIIKKEKLGYAHIKFETKYRDFMKKYFDTVLIEKSEEYYNRFMENREVLYEYSKELSKNKLDNRNKIYKDVRDEIYEKFKGDSTELIEIEEDEEDIEFILDL